MAKRNSLIKSEVLTALKEAGIATKNDVREIASDIVGQSERRLKRYIRAEIRQVRTDMAKLATDTPTRNEFNKLKERVDHYYPAI